jgi:hypothetical protein
MEVGFPMRQLQRVEPPANFLIWQLFQRNHWGYHGGDNYPIWQLFRCNHRIIIILTGYPASAYSTQLGATWCNHTEIAWRQPIFSYFLVELAQPGATHSQNRLASAYVTTKPVQPTNNLVQPGATTK